MQTAEEPTVVATVTYRGLALPRAYCPTSGRGDATNSRRVVEHVARQIADAKARRRKMIPGVLVGRHAGAPLPEEGEP